MPNYYYHCSKCNGNFEKRHSMVDLYKFCDICGEDDSIIRIPQLPIDMGKESVVKSKPGVLTNKLIEEAREDLREQKEEAERGRK
ncbi:MAG: zinc ribbon domain-containing protein [Nanoarchaeota archaeon]|nr:zinc ribbon domain-containing protein [Nanoarchaeota archaeon]